MLYNEKPENFITEIEVAGCVIEYNWEILLMKRSTAASFAWKWQQPWGKVDIGEDPEQAMIREVYEESWIVIKSWAANKLFKKYFHFSGLHIVITFFKTNIDKKPEVSLSPTEHSEYKWLTPREALKMDLIEDFDLILKEIYKLT